MWLRLCFYRAAGLVGSGERRKQTEQPAPTHPPTHPPRNPQPTTHKQELEGMEARKRQKRKQQQQEAGTEAEEKEERRVVRRFRQHAPLGGEGSGARAVRDKGVLRAVFK